MDVGLLRQYAADGLTRMEIAEKIGMSYSRTTTVLRDYGIYVDRKIHKGYKRGPHEQTKKILELRRQGLKYKEISAKLGCCNDTVKEACIKYGLRSQDPRLRIDENQAADLVSRAGYDYVRGFLNSHSTITVRCRQCGKEYERTYANIRKEFEGKYTNKPECPCCRKKAIEKREAESRAVKQAEKEREAQIRARRKAEQLSRKTSEQLAKRLANHVCNNCGKEYCIEVTGYDSESYCSKQCQQRWHNRIKNEKRIDKLKARPHDTDITLEKLFNRDGGVCYICGKLCDWTDISEQDGTMIAGDHYPSVDHVKPVSKGGTHTWDNIKLACRSCNTKKGWK